jgi:pilus assembly protein Flp/PilA
MREVTLKRHFSKFCSGESGATTVEYGLIAAGISLAIIAAVTLLGGSLSTNFTSIDSSSN